MKKVFSIVLLIFSASLSAENKNNSITLHNTSNVTKNIWVSGEELIIKNNSSLRIPCNAGESIYVQSIQKTNLLSCGSSDEVNDEY